jgi:hypothetical protein
MLNKKVLSILLISIIAVCFIVVGIVIFSPPQENPNPDETAPTVEILSPTNTSYLEPLYLLNIAASDNIGIDTIWYNWNGTDVIYTSAHNITFNYGLNTIHVWAKDSAGNIGSSSVSFTVMDSFKSTWDTTKTSSGSSLSTQVKLPLYSGGIYDFTVDRRLYHLYPWNHH